MKYQSITAAQGEPGQHDAAAARAWRFGPRLTAAGVRFALWAPSHAKVELELGGRDRLIPMRKDAEGFHEVEVAGIGPGARYRFVLPDGTRAPDPASRFQPDDVHGFSAVIAPDAYAWGDAAWTGRPWGEAVIYQLHVGAFTPEGTFRAAIDKLAYLRDLGVTALQLMPIGDFPGRRGWGYDGAYPYAPEATYGAPDDLKALIDAAHSEGLMVFLDVVYNHFGPDGAYIHSVAPEMFSSRHATPWGRAINTDGPQSGPVRRFFIENALYWLEEFHADGLRLDAVHALKDESPVHILADLAAAVRARCPAAYLILENEDNESSWLTRGYTAQWNDDVHHVLHTAATGEAGAYYQDYAGNTERLGRALAQGFAFQGEVMPFRGSPRGEPSGELPPAAFIAFIQNHDQIGNRPGGERITTLAPEAAVRAVSAVYLLSPQIPMLFMGEEWGAERPFPFFCDFAGDLADKVREGRKKELGRCPASTTWFDPLAAETFAAAKLDWEKAADARQAWTKGILAARRTRLPVLAAVQSGGTWEVIGQGAVVVRWAAGAHRLQLCANLSGIAVAGFPPPLSDVIWQEGDTEGGFGPWSVQWSVSP